MARKQKLGDRVGVSEWRDLANAGDARRFVKWCIHSVRNQTLDVKTAAVFSQLAAMLLKALETSDFEKKLEALERTVLEQRDGTVGNGNGTARPGQAP